jgi:dihydrolipoamide dehydrogenase
MPDYELLVIGGGAANKVASAASGAGIETAFIEPRPLGGTCLNRGGNPPKMLIEHANGLNAVLDVERFRLDTSVDGFDIAGLDDEVNGQFGSIAEGLAEGKREDPNLTLYNQYAEFVDHRLSSLMTGRSSTARRSSSEPAAGRSSHPSMASRAPTPSRAGRPSSSPRHLVNSSSSAGGT